MLNWNEQFDRIKKCPSAVGAILLCAVFSLLIVPEQKVFNPVILLAWLLGCLMLLHIWFHFKADKTYRVSGIVPAWGMLLAGMILLPLIPWHELCVGLVLLSVCSYSGGIIFAIKMIVPFSILLGMCAYSEFLNVLLSDTLRICCVVPAKFLLKHFGSQASYVSSPAPGFMNESIFTPWEKLYGGPLLVWCLLLIAFILVWCIQRTTLDQFYHYVVVIPVIWLMTLFHCVLTVAACLDATVTFISSLLLGVALFILSGIPLLRVSAKKTKNKGMVK